MYTINTGSQFLFLCLLINNTLFTQTISDWKSDPILNQKATSLYPAIGRSFQTNNQSKVLEYPRDYSFFPFQSYFNVQLPQRSHNQAFFCRQEWKLEKKSKVPLRFRLGDVDKVNQLEGKTPLYLQRD